MTDSSGKTRRRFLQATGATAAVALAGCSSDSNSESSGNDTSGNETGTGTENGGEGFQGLDSYPYGANETRVGEAKRVMEEAGYGPDNRFELNWLQYTSPAWTEMANTIRARLESAYIDMNINEADFSALIDTTEKGEHEAYTLGWIADYPGGQNFLQLVDPPNTIYDADGYTPNGARLFWSEDAKGDASVRQYMIDQFDQITDNPGNSDSAETARNEAAVRMEEGLWESAALLPIYHQASQVFWYDRLDYNPPGGMGGSRSKENISVNGLEGKSRLDTISATFSTLDPIASGNTASGGKIMNMFDAPMNYQNGTTEVQPLIVEDYTSNDDLTEYEFTLKEGIQFHGDYGEVTASDVVYSIRRLVESTNSTNTYFPISVLDIARETDDDGNVVSGSTGVEATGDYTFKITLNNPFTYVLPVLAYSAFSVVPEGIVGDIEGYEGEMGYEEFSTSNPIGCGPFQFANWESGNGGSFSADRFDDYHGQMAAIEGIDSAIITDTTARFNYFLNGNADVAAIPTAQYNPNKADLGQAEGGQATGTYGPLENDQTVNMAETSSINTYFVGFHMEKVPKAVRQAMAYVINQEQFVNSVFKGRGNGAFHLQPPQVFPGGAEAYESHWQGSGSGSGGSGGSTSSGNSSGNSSGS
ncbi:ABC transporter substrate-binding protein [Halomarina salina]|uniref:ABC transporter substrate-binding protein n=1 Tax=Halomarina salina TaxID=1872699 RepID=A0ABD5RL63_9EURY|nr:ABC transporter substrate-binding protein [Halomarina salina]